MMECTLHNLLTSCQYPQVFWIYQVNDYDENILLTKGTKQEMLEDDENSFDLIDHINDVVEYWTIREDGAMFVRIRMDDRAKELFSEDYVKKWDRFNPLKRPYLYTAELDDFTNCIYGSSEYLHPYGDPLDCHHFDNDDRKTENCSEKPNNCEELQDWKDRMWAEAIVTEPTISKMEQVDKPQTDCGDFADRLAYERGVKHAWKVAQKVFDSTVTFYEAEDVAKQIDKDINVRSKDEPQLHMDGYYRKIEPQTDCAWGRDK